MNFFIIHNSNFPLRKSFLEAQFKRYGINEYEFINIVSETRIMSAYMQAFEKITQDDSIQYGVILTDIILLSRDLLEYIYYAHLQMVSCEKSQDIIFISQSNILSKRKNMKVLNPDRYNWNTEDVDIHYSNSFVISKKAAQIAVSFNNKNIQRRTYDTIDDYYRLLDPISKQLLQNIKSVDLFLFNIHLYYQDDFFVYWLK